MDEIEFVNAQEMAKAFPDTFYCPNYSEMKDLSKGDYVKISTGNERFWVKILEIDGDKITGKVDNILYNYLQHGLVFGDVVSFEKKHIHSLL